MGMENRGNGDFFIYGPFIWLQKSKQNLEETQHSWAVCRPY
jgi:hypothetical protein